MYLKKVMINQVADQVQQLLDFNAWIPTIYNKGLSNGKSFKVNIGFNLAKNLALVRFQASYTVAGHYQIDKKMCY